MQRFSRNLGLLTEEQQSRISQATVAVSGVGGMGGVAAEGLARMGVKSLILLDHDVYELSNMNRQMHCTESVIGRHKVDVVAEKLKEINPEIKIKTHRQLTTKNVGEVVDSADLLINGMDELVASITLEREARSQRKTIVDAWLTPYASVFVMTPDSPHWEEFLEFPTQGKRIEEITPEDVVASLRKEIAFTFSQFDPYAIVPEQLVEDVITKRASRPSLLPVVWMSGTLMANEAMKVLTGQGRIASHWGVFYNQYDHEMKFYTGVQSHGKFGRKKAAS